jgi:hypothetical protein
MGVWQVVTMDSIKFHLGLLCPTLLRPMGGPPLKWPYCRFGGSPPAAVFYLRWTAHAGRLWSKLTITALTWKHFDRKCVYFETEMNYHEYWFTIILMFVDTFWVVTAAQLTARVGLTTCGG